MEELISYQNTLLSRVHNKWQRYLYPQLKNNKERMIGIKGLRGIGKTTMLLQYLAFDYPTNKGLYVTADHPYFYQHSLFDLAGDWYRGGGELILIDEVHKYANWSRELKLIYDGFPEMRILFTSSSALDLYRGESDLSRRLGTLNLCGLSFREFLMFHYGINIEPMSLEEILTKSINPLVFPASFKPLVHFKEYIKYGYFPFANENGRYNFYPKLLQIINTVLESDLAFIKDYNASNINKIKSLLGVIASSAPFEPNISKIAEKLHLGRNTVNLFIQHLSDAMILNLVNKKTAGIAQLQKPNKIYFENTSFTYAFQDVPDTGTLRETFFINQMQNAGHKVKLSPKADFLINNKWTFEIGGKNKKQEQIKNIKNSFLAVDNIDYGFGNRIPLWLFGMLY